jgi:23S rRNA (uracil1939-C5)-methyltransferase
MMEITIEKLVYGGDGLAHHDGSTVFVPFVLPTERVSATAIEQKKKFVRACVERLLTSAPERVPAPCPHFGVCGGCHYQHMPYEGQLKYKTEILRETLRRLGRIEWQGEIGVHPSPPWGYRNRAQWKIRGAREASGLSPGIGYFRANSTALCPVQECAILSPLLLKTLLGFRAALAERALPPELREIEAFAGANDTRLLVTANFTRFPSGRQRLADTFQQIAPEMDSLLFHDPNSERMELDGPGFVECEAAGATFRVGHLSFFQVNRFLAGELARHVAETADAGRLALDLFAGVGLFSLLLAKRFERVIAVEANPAATRDLESNAAGKGSIEIRNVDAEQFLDRCREDPGLVVLDPPRAGLEPKITKHLARIGPKSIAYVSCEPPTLARDLAALTKAGYEVSGVDLFDLFPQTFHIESVVCLSRST